MTWFGLLYDRKSPIFGSSHHDFVMAIQRGDLPNGPVNADVDPAFLNLSLLLLLRW